MKRLVGLYLLAAAIMLLTFVRPAASADQKNNVDLESVFKILDVNNDKVVTNKDKDKDKDAKTRAEIFKKLDTNKDGKLTFEEFKKITNIIDDYALNKKKK